MKKILLSLFIIIFIGTLFSCGNNVIIDDPIINIEYGTIKLVDSINNSTDEFMLEVGTDYTFIKPTNNNYTFSGWYLDEDFFNGPYEKITISSGYYIYFAKWEIKEEVVIEWGNSLYNDICDFLSGDEKSLDDAYILKERYNNLYPSSKSYVSNINELDEYISNTLKEALINECIDKITSLGSVSELKISDKEKVNNVIEYINSNVEDDDIVLITNYDTLSEMLSRISVLETVLELINAIDKLPNPVTLDDEENVKALYIKYNQIKIVNRSLVTNSQILLDAKSRIDNLKKVSSVIERIANLPDVITIKDRSEIYYCNSDYEKLTIEQKELVTNYDKLVLAKASLDELIGNGEALAKEFDEKISYLPSTITYDFSEEVKELKAEYDTYPEEVTTCLKLEDKLINAYNTIISIENDVNNITYCLGKYNYFSRAEFYTAFIGEFYDYISYHYGEKVANSAVNNKTEFLTLGKTWDAGRGEMRAFGDTYGSYFTAKDTNGIIQNQPTSCYFGYCYQNDKYMDFFDFFFRFFAYWRIDEGYAKQSNYGADVYAEAWAPCVDFCKFFYFEVDTCYVKTDRMKDCYNNCANVVYGDFSSGNTVVPLDISLRGYTFAGWYDNKEFNGSPVTSVAPGSKKTILYAKWVVDSEQVDLDNARLVDVYLYNITCTPAKKNVTTANYIFDMYDALSTNAKSLVNETSILDQLYAEFEEALEDAITIKFTTNIPAKSFDELKIEFLADYNSMFNLELSDYSAFTSNQYVHMKNLLKFFANKSMYAKWGFIPSTIADMNLGNGLGIQASRAVSGGSGDLEYLSCAIDAFFSGTDMSSNSTYKIDFSDAAIINTFINNQNTFKLTFTSKVNLPIISYDDLTFKGYYRNGTLYTKVSSDIPLELDAIFE